MLKRSDNCIPGALENANHPALGPVTGSGPASFSVARRNIAADSRHHAIAIHRGSRVLRCDKDIRLSRFLRNEKAVACLVDRQFSGYQIGFGRQNVTVLAYANDFSGVLEFAQSPAHIHAVRPLCTKRFSNLVSILWPVMVRAQQGKDLFSNRATVFGHSSETICRDCSPQRIRPVADRSNNRI